MRRFLFAKTAHKMANIIRICIAMMNNGHCQLSLLGSAISASSASLLFCSGPPVIYSLSPLPSPRPQASSQCEITATSLPS